MDFEINWVVRILFGGFSLLALVVISLIGISKLVLKFVNRKDIKISERLLK
jgi:hypothetical protein